MSDLVMQIRALEAAIDRVRRLHDNEQYGLLAPGRYCPGCGEEIPCRTIRALNGQTKEGP